MDQIKTIADSVKQILISTVIGAPTAESYIKSIKSNLDENPMKYVVWDYAKADLSGLTNQELENVMNFSVRHPNSHMHKKVALILPTDLSFGLGRMFEVFGSMSDAPWELKAFRSAEEAFRWLGVQDIRETRSSLRK
jgi:hypothetical protein